MDQPFGLGRRQATDWNDLNYMWSASPFAQGETDRTFRYWNDSGLWLNQGQTEMCVEYSLHHYLADGPVTQGKRGQLLWTPGEPYKWMQENDEFPDTPPAGGTSLRAGAKWATDHGYLESYWWGMNVQEVKTHVLEIGPVWVGTIWPRSMWFPNRLGIVEINDDWVGGHAYEINGYNGRVFQSEGGLFRIKQSYGQEHGRAGHIYCTLNAWRPLLESYQGEAMMGKEVRPKAQ